MEHLGDLSPFVVHNSVHKEEDPLFLLTPVNLLDEWVQVIVPSLSALLANSVFQVLCDKGPFLGSVGDNKLEYSPVFFLGPCTLNIGNFFLLRNLEK